MSRPKYENDITLQYEAEFKAKYERIRPQYLLTKLNEKQYIVDYAVTDHEKRVKGFIEFKRRLEGSETYPDIILSLSKWMQLLKLDDWKPAAFFVQFDDKLMVVFPPEVIDDIRISGRSDRNDIYDQEPCVHIPINRFKEVKKEGQNENTNLA